MFRKWFSDPEDNNPSFLRMTRNILLFTTFGSIILLVLVSGVITNAIKNTTLALVIAVMIALQALSFILNQQGRPGMAKSILPPTMFIAATYAVIVNNGIHDINMLLFPLIVVIGALFLRSKFIYFTTPLALICIGFIVYADISGITRAEMAKQTTITTAIIGGLLIVLLSAILQLLITRLNESTKEALSNEKAQIEANKELIELQGNLEQRILERTAQLSRANDFNQRRSEQFKTIAQVTRLIANIRETNELLPTITRVISERFGYYHVGIFLLDESKQYAILSAANSEGGKRMLQRAHRLRVGETGLVGYAAAKGTARIALDTGVDSVYFNNPDLTETRSEIALPLQISNAIIGVLDVQSIEPNAFVQEDIETLTTLADQVAIAIRNAELFRETEIAIAESQVLYGTVVKQAWKTNLQLNPQVGYKFTGTIPTLLNAPLNTPEAHSALESGNIVITSPEKVNGEKSLAVPLKLRGEIIGVVNIKMPAELHFGEDEADIVSAAAERIALALENSSLLEDSKRRVTREKTISDISAKIGAGTEIETILITAIRELGAQISGAQISVEIGNESE